MKNICNLIIISVFPLIASGAITTDRHTYTSGIDYFSGTDVGNTSSNIPNLTADLAQFNPATGTLNSFNLTWSLSYSGSFTISGSSLSNGGSGSYEIIGTMYIAGFSYSGDSTNAGNGGGGFSIDTTLDVGPSMILNAKNFISGNHNPAIDPAVQGAGTIEVLYGSTNTGNSGDYSFSPSGDNFLDANFQLDPGSYVEISYDYTPVPEAETVALGLGVFALSAAGLRQWRKSKSPIGQSLT